MNIKKKETSEDPDEREHLGLRLSNKRERNKLDRVV